MYFEDLRRRRRVEPVNVNAEPTTEIDQIRPFEQQKRQYTTTEVGL